MEAMLNYPIAVAGIFSKNNEPDPTCTICFFATTPAFESPQQVENYICSNVFSQLAQAIANSGPDIIAALIDQFSAEISEKFNVSCQGYLNESHLSGAPRGEGGDENV